MNQLLEGYRLQRLSYYEWRNQATWLQMLALAGGLACLMGLLSQVKVFLPWTPVPIVAAQLGIILSAVLLGRNWAGISMIIYVLGGMAGIPWFAGASGGLAVLFSPTSGYLLGYIIAAAFMGHCFDNQLKSRKALPLMGIILFAQLVLVYVPGLIYLYLWLGIAGGQDITLANLLYMGFIPFVVGDVIKSLLGAVAAKAVLPGEK